MPVVLAELTHPCVRLPDVDLLLVANANRIDGHGTRHRLSTPVRRKVPSVMRQRFLSRPVVQSIWPHRSGLAGFIQPEDAPGLILHAAVDEDPSVRVKPPVGRYLDPGMGHRAG